MNENQLTIVKEYEFHKLLIHKLDSIIDNCFRECHNKYFHTFIFECEYDIKLINLTNNEIFNTTISNKSLGLFELGEKTNTGSTKRFF